MTRVCTDSPPGQLLQGIREFNSREWFECHETIEDIWIGSEGEVKDLYQGIIQVAVALHHWRNGNFGGAMSLLKGGAGYLRRISGSCLWVDVAALIEDADRMREALDSLGAERMTGLDPDLIPLIRTVSSAD